jgi:hypothetical protein
VGFVVMGIRLRSALGVVLGVGVVLGGAPGTTLAAGERTLEQVSPQAKNADVEPGGPARAGKSGEAVAYQSLGSFAPAASRGFLNEFRSARTPTGWTTTGMNPPQDPYPHFALPQEFQAVSPDASVGVGKSWGMEEFGHPQVFNLWRIQSGGGFDLLSAPLGVTVSPEIPVIGEVRSGSSFSGGSEDFSHIVFDGSRRLVEDAPGDPCQCMYEWANGHLRLVPYLPDAEGGGVALGSVLGYGNPVPPDLFYPGQYAVSADGARIFFSTFSSPATPERELYVRQDDPTGGKASVHVSESERTDCAGDPTCGGDGQPDPTPDPDAPKAALFQLASADGDGPAFFSSPQKLTDDATATNDGGFALGGDDYCAFRRCDLYRWDPSGATGERLIDLTAGAPEGGGLLGVVGGSDDASRVYFVAIADLAAGGDEGEPNLYLWQQGQGIRFIAALDSSKIGEVAGDVGVWRRLLRVGSGDFGFGGGARASRDGRFLVFRSRAQVTGYDNAGRFQVYRYDATAESVVCVSCNPRAGASTGAAFLKREAQTSVRPPWVSRNVSTDGDVVFDSTEALVSEDTNGRIDVYEWSDGQVRLISSGTDDGDSAFLDASESGKDVFFTTRAKLVGTDDDNLVDLYDARVGGGFPQPIPKPVCEGDACQGAPSTPPDLSQPATETGRPQGQAKPDAKPKPRKAKCRKGFVKKRIHGKARCAKKKRTEQGRRGR